MLKLPGQVFKEAVRDTLRGNDMPTLGANANTAGFLSDDFPQPNPKVYLTAESDDFDDLTIREWEDEGFDVLYLPMRDGGAEYRKRLEGLSAGLGVGQLFAIVGYGDAAAFCLEHYLRPMATHNKLCSLIAYYPTSIPDTRTRFPSGVRVLVHLAGTEVGVSHQPQVLGIEGKRRIKKRHINPGIGTGGTLKISYPTHVYNEAEPGFAEHDLDEYERISAELAWSRTLDVVRRAFRKDVDLETPWEENLQNRYFSPSVDGVLRTLTTGKTPRVTHAPTLTGGIGKEELRRFYKDFFLETNPPSMRMRLLSRTIGADRVVDELHISFTHSKHMPWILPGVPATNKPVQIIVVSIVSLRGAKLYHEHVYWDQASVLVQIGLLDPNLVPKDLKRQGVRKLPVVGREAARRVLHDGSLQPSNELIPGWNKNTNPREEEEEDDDDEGEAAGETEDEEAEEEAGNEADDEIEEDQGVEVENQEEEDEQDEPKRGEGESKEHSAETEDSGQKNKERASSEKEYPQQAESSKEARAETDEDDDEGK